MNQEEYNSYLQKMMALCSKGEKCAFDIERKLRKWQVPEEQIQHITEDLKSERFIDHMRYTQAFVNDKLAFNHWGKIKIKYALKERKIEEPIIEKVLSQISPRYYEEILEEELEKKYAKLLQKPDNKGKEKIIRYLTQKGFEYGKVFELLEARINRD